MTFYELYAQKGVKMLSFFGKKAILIYKDTEVGNMKHSVERVMYCIALPSVSKIEKRKIIKVRKYLEGVIL